MPAEYHPTAIARGEASAPVRHLWTHARGLFRGTVLDYGCGRGADVAALRARGYDPWHPDPAMRREPTGQFGTVLLTYVLNVLPPRPRVAALVRAAARVRPGGYLAVTVRPESDVRDTTAAWPRHADGRKKGDHFQRGYTDASLTRELDRALGDAFTLVDVPPMANGILAVLQRDKHGP